MKVKDFIEELRQFDPDLDVLCYTEDDIVKVDGHEFRLFDFNAIGIVEGEKIRGKDEIPSLKLGKHANSEKHVLIDITSVF